MGYVKQQIAILAKEHNGKINASRFSENWFNEAIRSKSIKEAQSTPKRFEPGKIYVFEYFPKYKNELPWFDKNPVVLAIEQVGNNDFGVNLNLLPVPVKEKLLDDIYSRLQSAIEGTVKKQVNPLKQRPLKISYEGMKAYLEKFGCDFALRQYIPSRKKGQAVVSYSKWPEIALCNFIQLEGTNLMDIRNEFKEYFRKEDI